MTCLCSQMFIVAVSSVLPVYPSSFASSRRSARLLGMPSNDMRSTMETRQLLLCPLLRSRSVMIASTSTGSADTLDELLLTSSKLGLGETDVGGAFVGIESRCPVMRSQIWPK